MNKQMEDGNGRKSNAENVGRLGENETMSMKATMALTSHQSSQRNKRVSTDTSQARQKQAQGKKKIPNK